MRTSDRSDQDLTARARIRDAALRYFAEFGFERATIRDIARAAGVSPGLLRHHYGSKEDLRRACDAYAVGVLREYSAQAMAADPSTVGAARAMFHPFQRYLARALIDDSPAAAQIFDEMVAITEEALRRADELRPDPAATDSRTRAALMVAMVLGIPAFQAQVGRVLGTDIASAQGDRRVVAAMLDIYSRPVLSPEDASALQAGLREAGA